MMDTLGVGSFATNIACLKYFRLFKDEELPATINCSQIIPGLIEALFFFKLVKVDPETLFVLVIGASIGGWLGVLFHQRMNPQRLRLLMCIGFPVIIFLIIAQHLHLFTIGGDLNQLQGLTLVFAFFGVMFAGAMSALGIGFFCITQAILFLCGLHPLVAFPIMTAAGALQQPITTIMYLRRAPVNLKKTAWNIAGGLVGVALALPLVTILSIRQLHGLLVTVLAYNSFMMGRTYLKERQQTKALSDLSP